MNTRAREKQFTKDTEIALQVQMTSPLRHALRMVETDHIAVFGQPPTVTGGPVNRADIMIRRAEPADCCPDWPEAFAFRYTAAEDGEPQLHIVANDELGFVYGLLHYSHRVLGVDPFWFWADLPPAKRESIAAAADNYDSARPKVRYRGWFVNDEVCLIGWKDEYPPGREVWLPVFEALLRCGGNMVIPGTDLPKSGIHAKLAAEMGLWVTHHHAEPLGAEMFLRAYPGKQASYKDHPELFETLWREAVEKQKDDRIVWVLSFRGQGDKPFWENDPSFDTPEKRGAMISYVVRRQYEMVREAAAEPVCCMAMYGEIAELYKGGYIDVPEGIIKVWADNGYGQMVSRRHGNLNLRIPALPEAEDRGKHGIYYHVTFHDLQASNHLAMFSASPELIAQQLEASFEAGASEYVLVNCGNIRPHIYTLDLVAQFWSGGKAKVEQHLTEFAARLFHTERDSIVSLFQRYFEATISYGPNADDKAGDEFYHHPARKIIGHWLQGKHDTTEERLVWATGSRPFEEQVSWFGEKTEAAIPGWLQLKEDCLAVMRKLPDAEAQRLQDHLLLHVELHLTGCEGFASLCKAFAAYKREEYPFAFVHASESLWSYARGQAVLSQSEHGKWAQFYRADWLTNIDNTMQHVDTLRRYLRMHGDSPDMFLWYKEYIMPETEKHIYLENTHRNPPKDDALAVMLRDKFRAEGLL